MEGYQKLRKGCAQLRNIGVACGVGPAALLYRTVDDVVLFEAVQASSICGS